MALPVAATAAVAAAAALALVVFGPGRPVAPASPWTTYATGVGERRGVALADGGRIDLDGATRLSVSYAADGRRVRLERGEAAFDVVHDPRRPFTVEAGAGEVRVLGTAFDIDRSEGGVRVAVSRGVVRFSAAGRSVELPRGQAADYDGGGVIRLAEVEPASVGAWQGGRRVYRDQSLQAVAADLNRLFPHPIRLADPRVAGLKFTGVLVVDDERRTVDRLTALLPLRAREVDGAVVLELSRFGSK